MRLLAGASAPCSQGYDADVVILALDRIEDTLAAIRSALSQTGVTRHVCVIDQGSRPEHLQRLAGLIGQHSDATLIALNDNLGVAGGRNLGSAFGHGRIIVGLDNDAEFADTTVLARAVATLDADMSIAAIGFRIVTHDSGADDVSSWGYPLSLLQNAASSFDSVTFVGAGHAIRRAAWTGCDGYDDALFFCWEEFDFCLRAIAAGWRIRYRGDLVVRHKVSPERRCGWSTRRWFYFVRNRIYISRKWGAGWVGLLPRLAAYLIKGARNGMLRQTLAAIVAAAALQGGAPRAMPPPMRRYLQQNDRVHRGSLLRRALREMWHALPGAAGSAQLPARLMRQHPQPLLQQHRKHTGTVA